MVVIRLTRVGKKKQAHYRIVVADSHRAVQGKFISILGWYNPHTKELQVKKDELKGWLDKGAVPSNTLAKLLKKEGVTLPKWVKIVEKKKAPKKTEEKKEAPKAEAKPEEDTEAPVEETSETPAEEVKEETVEAPPVENAEPEAGEEEKPEEKPAEEETKEEKPEK